MNDVEMIHWTDVLGSRESCVLAISSQGKSENASIILRDIKTKVVLENLESKETHISYPSKVNIPLKAPHVLCPLSDNEWKQFRVSNVPRLLRDTIDSKCLVSFPKRKFIVYTMNERK